MLSEGSRTLCVSWEMLDRHLCAPLGEQRLCVPQSVQKRGPLILSLLTSCEASLSAGPAEILVETISSTTVIT